MISTAESYRYCRRVARRRARNFYYSFILLPPAKRDAICAIYAFMRYCDDLSDEEPQPASAREAITRWRADLEAALAGRCGEHPIWPAFRETVCRYDIPGEYFRQMIDGITSDLGPRRIQTFQELYRYCYQVASVVGLTVIRIFGCRSAEALPLAEKCGVAFQLTNVLRDVGEDLRRDRVYIPAEDLARFGVDLADLKNGRRSPAFLEMMRFEAARARRYYEESAPIVGMVDASSRPSLRALIEIYSRLLTRIERSGFDVLSRRIELSLMEKLRIAARAVLGLTG